MIRRNLRPTRTDFCPRQEDEATQKSLMGGASKALGAVVGVLSAVGTLALTLLSIFSSRSSSENLPPSANATVRRSRKGLPRAKPI